MRRGGNRNADKSAPARLAEFDAMLVDYRGVIEAAALQPPDQPAAEALSRLRTFTDGAVGCGTFDRLLVTLVRGAVMLLDGPAFRERVEWLRRDEDDEAGLEGSPS
jgi:hypothetical protein